MKLPYIASFILLLSACQQTPKLELTIKANGITNGTVQLKQANELTFNEVLKNGELTKSMQLQSPGYYSLSIIDNDKPITSKIAYDIYLENGAYTIQPDKNDPDAYPVITTASATQKELSSYYTLAHERAAALDKQVGAAVRYLETKEVAAMSKTARADMYTRTRALQKKRRDMDLAILKEYTEKHPKAKIGAHLMAQQYYPENPVAYNEIFQKFPDEVKMSDDGLKISNKLGPLLSQFAGATAPDITGNTADGKPFNKQGINKAIILVEFWKPSNEVSQLMHQQLVKGIILTPADEKKLGIVTVAIDDKTDVWLNAIKKDNKPWQQLNDSKGDQSPNVAKWEIKTLPKYFLVDKDWKVIKSNVPFNEIDTEVHDYLHKK